MHRNEILALISVSNRFERLLASDRTILPINPAIYSAGKVFSELPADHLVDSGATPYSLNDRSEPQTGIASGGPMWRQNGVKKIRQHQNRAVTLFRRTGHDHSPAETAGTLK